MIEQRRNLTQVGDVKIHNNAIKAITELTVSKIEGVVRINRNPLRRWFDAVGLGKTSNLLDGIKVESGGSNVKIILDVIAAYGVDISEVAITVQDEVKQAVENMAGIASVEVDVNVAGVEPAETGGKK